MTRFFLLTVASLLLLTVLAGMLVRMPVVQTWLVEQTRWVLERELGTEVQLAGVDFALPAKAILQGVVIRDTDSLEMIRVDALRVNALSFPLWRFVLNRNQVHTLAVQGVELLNPVFNLRRRADSSLNLDLLLPQAPRDTNKLPPLLLLDLAAVEVKGGAFSYVDSTQANFAQASWHRLNFAHLQLDSLEVNASFLLDLSGRLNLQLARLSFEERYSGLEIDHLSASIVADTASRHREAGWSKPKPYIEVEDLSLRSGNTWLRGSLELPDEELGSLFIAGGDTYFRGVFDESRLDMDLINYFTADPLPVVGVIGLGGKVFGTFNHLQAEEMRLTYLDETQLTGVLRLDFPADPDRARLDLRIQQATLSARELKLLLPDIGLPPVLDRLKELNLQGRYWGGYRDFQVDMRTRSSLGEIAAILHMQLPPLVPLIRYEGDVTTRKLNLNALGLDQRRPSSNLNFKGKVMGQGDDLESLNLRLDASIVDSDLFGYAVDSLYGNVAVAKQQLAGRLWGADREGYADVQVDFDLAGSPAVYRVEGLVRQLNLATYGFYQEPVRVSSRLDIALQGDSLDALQGTVNLTGTRFERAADSLRFRMPDLRFEAEVDSVLGKHLVLKSSVLNADVAGDFSYQKVAQLGKDLVKEARLFLTNNDSLIQAYYEQKPRDSLDLDLKIGLLVQDSANQLLEFFRLPLQLATGSFFEGALSFGQSAQAELGLGLDSLRYGEVSLKQVTADLNLIKSTYANQLVVAGGILADSLRVGRQFAVESLGLDVSGLNNAFESDLVARQTGIDNRLQVKLYTFFAPEGAVRSYVDPVTSLVMVRGDTLRVSEGDSIIFKGEELKIRNLMLYDQERFLRLGGEVSQDSTSQLRFSASRLDLNFVNDLVELPFAPGGKISIDVSLTDPLNRRRLEGVGRIDTFALDGFVFGNIHLNSNWVEANEELRLRASLVDAADTTLSLQGYYDLADSLAPLHFQLLSEAGFPLNYIYPFVKTQLYDIKGQVGLDEFSITGSFEDLVINGTGSFAQAGIGIDYFKTAYTFDGEIRFDNNRIYFPTVRLYDRNRNHADLHGVIRHQGLRDFELDLQLDEMRNFLLMDLKQGENELFYGQVFIKNGIADITGDLEQLEVQAFVTSGKGTYLRIPVSETGSDARPSFIHFVGEDQASSTSLSTGQKGFELNLTAVITEEAQVDLIFDERVGDIIRSRGEGTLNMRINQEGEFNMFGDYRIQQGDYLFTAQNILNKKFVLRQGGRIIWTGDPYNATLDLEAYYTLYADVKDLLQQENSVRIPVNVLMHMEGSLLSPDIGLSIEIPSLNESDAALIASYLKTIQYDEQELNKQVFSLMVFNRFAPTGGFLGQDAAGTGVTTSVSELLSNQLNYWLSRAINDDVSVNIGTNNFQDVSLLVSAKLFNDRVTIERDGTLVDQRSNFAIGNISVIIKLLPRPNSGSQDRTRPPELVLEVFNRQSLNLSARDNNYETGMGIFYKKDFDSLRELLKRKKGE